MFHVKHFLILMFFGPILSFGQHLGRTVLPLKDMPPLPGKSPLVLNFLESFQEYKGLNTSQKDWFYWTSYSRSNPKAFWDSVVSPILQNFPSLRSPNASSLKEDLFKSASLSYLKPNNRLLKGSQGFAGEMANVNALPSHTSPSGVTFQDRMKDLGIKNCAGENISYGPSDPVLMLVLLYIDEGVANLGHRKSLLDPRFVEMGIGISKYANNNTIVIQDFACKQD